MPLPTIEKEFRVNPAFDSRYQIYSDTIGHIAWESKRLAACAEAQRLANKHSERVRVIDCLCKNGIFREYFPESEGAQGFVALDRLKHWNENPLHK